MVQKMSPKSTAKIFIHILILARPGLYIEMPWLSSRERPPFTPLFYQTCIESTLEPHKFQFFGLNKFRREIAFSCLIFQRAAQEFNPNGVKLPVKLDSDRQYWNKKVNRNEQPLKRSLVIVNISPYSVFEFPNWYPNRQHCYYRKSTIKSLDCLVTDSLASWQYISHIFMVL